MCLCVCVRVCVFVVSKLGQGKKSKKRENVGNVITEGMD